MSILWTIIIGFFAGIVAKFLHPGSSNEPSGFILTVALGIAGSLVATYLGQALGWYRAGDGAGFIGAVVGAIILLVVWGFLAPKLQKST
ncbi:MAG: GlsB/YeaQ/YmgE family stress response membrane protein [Pseudolabrys sp.]